MGYDDGECLQCRLIHNGGNTPEYARLDICLGCLHEFAKDSGAVDYRLISVLKENIGSGKCFLCRCRSIVFNVSACELHYNIEDWDSDDSLEY